MVRTSGAAGAAFFGGGGNVVGLLQWAIHTDKFVEHVWETKLAQSFLK